MIIYFFILYNKKAVNAKKRADLVCSFLIVFLIRVRISVFELVVLLIGLTVVLLIGLLVRLLVILLVALLVLLALVFIFAIIFFHGFIPPQSLFCTGRVKV